jgi:predicted enzyme related to lactoylglutathione lyase
MPQHPEASQPPETGHASGTSQDHETARVAALVHGQLCYLQLPAVDGTRAAAFYQAVFGWNIEEHAPDFEAPGLIGQWVEGRPPAQDAGPMIWLQVADMDGTLKQVTAHGGQLLEPPSPDGPDRTLATITDPEGNPIGLAAHTVPSDT